jgi:cystathionine beta-lyase
VSFDFDREISREGTSSVKYDGREACFGRNDVIPLWVADMDFASPEAVTLALQVRAQHPVYGYTQFPESMFAALMEWMKNRHNWKIEREWIVMCPGVVPSLHAAVLACAQAGEGVIIQPPVYAPFYSSIAATGRRLLPNPLRLEDGRYTIDLENLNKRAAEGARLLMLCSPHNPVGRVWSEQELMAILEIARRYNLIILSDEIHSDLVYRGNRHIPLAMLAEDEDAILTAVAPSKTFNIPGLGLSALIVPDPTHREALRQAFDLLHVSATNPFSIVAFEVAYSEGGPWLNSLLQYLEDTRNAVDRFLREHLPDIQLVMPEGTYLLWLDCRKLGMNDHQLKHFFVHQAGVGMSPGTLFGEGGSGFMRMNIGAPRNAIMKALENIELATRGGGSDHG